MGMPPNSSLVDLYDWSHSPAYAVIIAIVSLLATAANVFILVVVIKGKLYRKSHFIFLFSMALSDLLVGLGGLSFSLPAAIKGLWLLEKAGCSIQAMLVHSSSLISLTSLVFLSADRFVSLSWPIFYKSQRSRQVAIIASVASWIVCIIESCVLLGDPDAVYFEIRSFTCNVRYFVKPLYTGLVLGLHISPCVIAIVVFNIAVYCGLAKRRHGSSSGTTSKLAQKRRYRAACAVSLTVAAFVSFWLPVVIVTIYSLAGARSLTQIELFPVVWLILFSSVVNGIIFGIVNERFKAAAKGLCFKRNPQRIYEKNQGKSSIDSSDV